jgi:hypothetical protein
MLKYLIFGPIFSALFSSAISDSAFRGPIILYGWFKLFSIEKNGHCLPFQTTLFPFYLPSFNFIISIRMLDLIEIKCKSRDYILSFSGKQSRQIGKETFNHGTFFLSLCLSISSSSNRPSDSSGFHPGNLFPASWCRWKTFFFRNDGK